MRIEPYDPDQLDAVIRLSLRSWSPVFDSMPVASTLGTPAQRWLPYVSVQKSNSSPIPLKQRIFVGHLERASLMIEMKAISYHGLFHSTKK
jgi:hypothetical protein